MYERDWVDTWENVVKGVGFLCVELLFVFFFGLCVSRIDGVFLLAIVHINAWGRVFESYTYR